MTRAKNFNVIWKNLINILENTEDFTLPDVTVMSELGFSPSSWKVWKPKLIEKGKVALLSKNKENFMAEYYKKKKIWSIRRFSLEEIEEKREAITFSS